MMSSLSFTLVLIIFALATLTDLRWQKIPNGLVVTALALGLTMQAVNAGWMGLINGFGGCLTALLLFGILFQFRFIGGGDVKLMMAVCSFYEPQQALWICAAGIIVGGISSPILALFRVGWRGTKQSLKRYYLILMTRKYASPAANELAGIQVPYAPALAIGWLVYSIA